MLFDMVQDFTEDTLNHYRKTEKYFVSLGTLKHEKYGKNTL